MTTDENFAPTDADVTALAHRFWEEEGQPEGKADEHWQRAHEQLRGQRPNLEAEASGSEAQLAAVKI